jgi:hypothetical protein
MATLGVQDHLVHYVHHFLVESVAPLLITVHTLERVVKEYVKSRVSLSDNMWYQLLAQV